jgi:hypothetical protein
MEMWFPHAGCTCRLHFPHSFLKRGKERVIINYNYCIALACTLIINKKVQIKDQETGIEEEKKELASNN